MDIFNPELTEPELLNVEAQEQELFGGNALEVRRRIFNQMPPPKVNIKQKYWEITGKNFKTYLKETADEGWEYEENGKKLGIKSTGMAWDGIKFKLQADKVIGQTKRNEVKYESAFGEGIDIKIIQDNNKFQKIIEIESLESLGEIPENTEFLEFSFNILGDFILPEGTISDRLSFGENSFVNPIRGWDSNIESEETDSGVYGEITGKTITKKIPISWLKQATFPIFTDVTITYGSESVYNSASSQYSNICKLDSTHVAVCYTDNGDSGHGYAVVGSLSGTVLSWGTPVKFVANGTSMTDIAALDSTHFVVIYRDAVGDGFARIGVTSGTTISSYGTAVEYSSDGDVAYPAVTALDSTHFVVAYHDGTAGDGKARIGVTSGTTISSYGTAVDFNASEANTRIDVSTLDSTHFVIIYYITADSNLYAKVGTTSGTTISSFGTESTVESGATDFSSVTALDSTHFVVSMGSSTSSDGFSKVGIVSGTTISSYGSSAEFNTSYSVYCPSSALNESTFIVAYRDIGNSSYGTAMIGEVSGTTITFGTEQVFNSSATYTQSVVGVDSTHFVISYDDAGNSNYGTGIVGSIPEETILTRNHLVSIL